MMKFETTRRREATVAPRVSVVIPSYNHESYVGETIRSVLSQTYQDFELLIIDDGSRDASVEIIRQTLDELPSYNVQFIARENVGLCKTLNEGLRMSKGEFFAYIGSDDLWHSEKLERQINALQSADPTYGACFSDCLYIDESGTTLGRFSDFYRYKGGNIYDDLVWNRFTPHSPTNLFRRSVVIEVGGFNEAHAVEDRDLWTRLSRSYKVVYIESPLASWRSHGNNTGNDLEKMYEYGVEILEAVIAEDPKYRGLETQLRASLDGTQAYGYFAAGFRLKASEFALRSIRNDPFNSLAWRVLVSSATPQRVLSFLRTLRPSSKRIQQAKSNG
jgi:alpha-1,3-rhamnosyltransferase